MSKQIKQPAQIESPQEILYRVMRRPVLPGEKQHHYDALREILLAALKPKMPCAELLANQLVELEWDLLRHRWLRDALLRTEFIRQVGLAIQEASGIPALSFEPDTAAKKVGTDLAGADAAKREVALEVLEQLGISEEEIWAKADQAVRRDLEPHERQIAEIERRRRRLREDFDRVNALPAQPIEEAQIVET